MVLSIFQNNLLADINSPHKDFIIKKTREISQNIKCLVCQNQSIDDSNSEIAKDLKVLIKDKLQDGISDEEIYNFLRDRYGDSILLKPPFKTNTILLWVFTFYNFSFWFVFCYKIFKI